MDDVLSLLGLIHRAKKTVIGQDCLKRMKDIEFLFIASDTSDGNKERYLKKAYYYHIPYATNYDSTQLSAALGKENIKLIGITSKGFQKTISNKITGGTYGETDL